MPDVSEIYWNILSQLRDQLIGKELGIPVKLRKRPLLLVDDPLPIVVISLVPGEAERPEIEYFGGVAKAYPVLVTLFSASNDFEDEDSLRQGLALKKRVADAVYRRPTVTDLPGTQQSVWDVNLLANPAYEVAGGNARLFDVAAWALTYLSDEPRAT